MLITVSGPAGSGKSTLAKSLAEALDYTSKEIGATMRRLAERERPPTVEPWAYSGGTTWQVTLE